MPNLATTPLPGLWLDWCAATGHPVDEPRPEAVARFARQAHPSRKTLQVLQNALRGPQEPPEAPAWPQDAPVRLETALAALCWVGRDSLKTHWAHTFRARRDAYLLTLLAPSDQGGLGLSRKKATNLSPAALRDVRPRIGRGETPAGCPACAVHRWLPYVAEYTDYKFGRVQARANTQIGLSDHACDLPDPEAGWEEAERLIPGMNLNGDFDHWTPMSPRAITAIIPVRLLEAKTAQPPAPEEHDEPDPRPEVTRHFTEDEVDEVYADADATNKRIAALLNDGQAFLDGVRSNQKKHGLLTSQRASTLTEEDDDD